MMPTRDRVSLLIVGSAAAIVALLLWSGSTPTSVADEGVVVVRADAPRSERPPEASRMGAVSFPPVPRFDELTGFQRMAATASRRSDVEWSPAAEARLVGAIEPTMRGLKLDRVRCAQGACQIIGTLDQQSLSRDEAVRRLLDGGVQRGLREAGFVENGNMVIDAEGDDRLRFYQYAALPGLIG